MHVQESSSDGAESTSGWPSAEGVLVGAGGTASATEDGSDEAPAAGPGAGIDLAFPPGDEIQDRETRAGQSGSASEANNEATSTGAAGSAPSNGALGEEGNGLSDGSRANVRRDGNYQPNTPGNSAPADSTNGGTPSGPSSGATPPPPQPQPVVQDGSSNTVIIPEGGSQLNPTATGEKENTPGTNGSGTDPTSGAAPGYDADGNPLPGADGRVSMDDWIRLNDKDGDGQVDRNYVDLSGTEDSANNGEPTGAPAGAVGNGIPVPSVDLAGVELEERIPGGGPFANGGAESPFQGGPVLDDIRPGLRGRVPDVPYEQEGTGLPPGLERPNGLDTLAPGIGELLDRDGDGDGRPDATLPETEIPGFNPPVRGPGLTIPEDLGPREPGPKFEPEVDETPPPGNGGAYTPPVAEPPTGNGGAYPPSNPMPPHAGHEAAPEEPAIDAGATGPGASAPATGESLDVFLTPPAGPEPSAGAATAPGPVSASSIEPDGALAAQPAAPAWTLTASPAIAQFDGGTGSAAEGAPSAAESEPGQLSPELTALIASLRSAAETATGAFNEAWKREPDDGSNILEQLLEMLRDALFMGDSQPSDEELASQLAELEPSALMELERYAREHQLGELTETDDGLEVGG